MLPHPLPVRARAYLLCRSMRVRVPRNHESIKNTHWGSSGVIWYGNSMASRVFTQSFVVVGAIVEQGGKILLVKEAGKTDKGKWNQPAGWLDVGEDPLDAVRREVVEETGFQFEPTGLIGIYSLVREDLREKLGGTPHAVKIIFRGTIVGGALREPGGEIAELRWFTPGEIEAMDGSTLRDIDIKQEVWDYFAGRSYPLEILRHTVSQ